MKRIRHYAKQVFLLCLSLSVLCLGSCQKDFGNDNISDTSLGVGWEPSVTISGPTDWVSDKSNISLTLNGSYSGLKITWKCSAPDFQIISGQGTANLVCKFSSTQNPVVIAEIEQSSSGLTTVTEGRIQLKILHSLDTPTISGVGFSNRDVLVNPADIHVYTSTRYDVPVTYEWTVQNSIDTRTMYGSDLILNYYTYGLYVFYCRVNYKNEIFSGWSRPLNVIIATDEWGPENKPLLP